MGRLLLIVAFFIFFSLISWVYFYFTFYNFHKTTEETFYYDDQEGYYEMFADTSKQLIPKAGIKVDKRRYYFESYKRELKLNKTYTVFGEEDTLKIKIVN